MFTKGNCEPQQSKIGYQIFGQVIKSVAKLTGFGHK